jgi:hypothetical protein
MDPTNAVDNRLARRRERSLVRRWHMLLAFAALLAGLWITDFAQAASEFPLAG